MCDFDELIKNYDRSGDGIWAYPKNVHDYELPVMGFKIHISATGINVADIFVRVEKILQKEGVSYKVISSMKNLLTLNGGNYGYTQIGKVITVYPKNEKNFIKLLELLYVATLGFQAVDIPSDYRYKNSSVVFYRYGEMKRAGEQVADRRIREIPKGVVVPVDDFYIERYDKMPDRYIPLTCIRARGKSRVFQGIDVCCKAPVIIKEGIMLGEIDSIGYDGANAAMQERTVLSALSGNSSFPTLIDAFYSGSTFVVVEELKKGQTINQLIDNEEYSLLENNKNDILLQFLDILDELDCKKIRIGDISPDNIILGDTGKIFLIDVEYYRFYHQRDDLDIPGSPGFWCNEYLGHQGTIYAFLSLWYYLTFPQKYKQLQASSHETAYDCKIKEYQTVCTEAVSIIGFKDYNMALEALRKSLNRR